jgi:AcrR family transcriptional regulator
MGRAEQKIETRHRILSVARAAFLERGYDSTTLQLVADRAGVAVGTVVAHFPDKPALMSAAFHADLEDVLARAWSDTADIDGLVDRLVGVATGLYRFYAEHPALYRRMVQESLFLEDPTGALRAQLLGFLGRVEQLVGEARPDLPAATFAHGFFADYFYVLVGGLSGALPDVDTQAATLRALLALRSR